MSVKEHIELMLRHLEWANRRVLAALESQPEAAVRSDAVRLFAHVMGAERTWTSRVRGDAGPVEPWPSYSLDSLRAEMEQSIDDLGSLVSDMEEGDVERQVEYETTSGVRYTNTLGEILTQVMLHGAYHRGQVAWTLRHAGAEPVGTDLITMVRDE